MSAYVSIRQHTEERERGEDGRGRCGAPAYVSIRQRMPAYIASIRGRARAWREMAEGAIERLHTSAYVNIRQHTSAYVCICQHTEDREHGEDGRGCR